MSFLFWDALRWLEEEIQLAVKDEETETGVGVGVGVGGGLVVDVLHLVKKRLLRKGPIQASQRTFE